MAEELTYRSSGVDIEEAGRALRSVTGRIRGSQNENVVGGIGGFGALFRMPQNTSAAGELLVSSIDGVGTKTKVAAMVGDYTGIGADIVNHCANDILCQGARPLFFLDYYGCSRLKGNTVFEDVVGGMADACAEIGCAMVGGETAEMPGVYVEDDIDVVGVIVGTVPFENRLPKPTMEPGDAVIGIASNGLHTNGYSLARRALFEVGGLSVHDEVPGLGMTIGQALLRVHRCYFNSVYPILQDTPGISALAHLTGGGFFDNIPRILPSDRRVVIEKRSWTPLPIFRMIQDVGGIDDLEMHGTFNMGIGMIMVCERTIAAGIVQRLVEAGESAAIIGEIHAGNPEVSIF